MSKGSVDLKILKDLVAALENSITAADQIRENKSSQSDFIVEMSKSIGLAAGVMQEAAMLVMDIQSVLSGGADTSAAKDPAMKSILSFIKGGGTPGGTN
jgi:hypothetical protein